MWVFTTEGFVSAVQHRTEQNKLVVRARAEHALEALGQLAGVAIQRTPSADYPFRVMVPRDLFQEWIALEVEALNYFNFKDAAHSLQDKRYDKALIKVWSAMYESEASDTRLL